MLTCRFLRRSFPALSVATALAIGSVEPSDAAPNLTATLVDRDGNRYDVTRLRFQDRYELEIYADDVRQLIMLADVDRIQMSGDKGAEELDIVLQLRSGRELKATIYSGSSVSPHLGTIGPGQSAARFDGLTALGPFSIMLSEVRDVILHHQGEGESEPSIHATVISVSGKLFEVTNLRYRSKTNFVYWQGRAQRSKEMSIISELEFGDTVSGEIRPVTVTFWSGKKAQGTVDASTVRVSGETDRMFERRILSAFTGDTASGPFNMGLKPVKLIRFKKEVSEGQPTASADAATATSP